MGFQIDKHAVKQKTLFPKKVQGDQGQLPSTGRVAQHFISLYKS
uniref:Uncharacterized protein n=1 Tax=Arundo donax TaxID=35708 RepID=A0A0A9ATI4_ARUDO